MLNLKPYQTYQTKNERSLYKNIPIAYRAHVLAMLKLPQVNPMGYKFRLMYRGPRRTQSLDTRSRYSKQSGCLMRFANRFSVYFDNRADYRKACGL